MVHGPFRLGPCPPQPGQAMPAIGEVFTRSAPGALRRMHNPTQGTLNTSNSARRRFITTGLGLPLLVNAAILGSVCAFGKEPVTVVVATLLGLLLVLGLSDLKTHLATSAFRALVIPATLVQGGAYPALGIPSPELAMGGLKTSYLLGLTLCAWLVWALRRLDRWCQVRFHWSLGRLVDHLRSITDG